MKTLKILPINNKTILKDSKILPIVEKWSNQIAAPPMSLSPGSRLQSDADSQAKERDNSSEETEDGTPKMNSTDTSSQPNTPVVATGTVENFENFPPKKRPFLQRLQQQEQQEEASSSEGEHSDTSKAQAAGKDGGAGAGLEEDFPVETGVITELASSLIGSWSELKVHTARLVLPSYICIHSARSYYKAQ